MGLTKNGNKSTASRFKYGKTYFVPSLKIHKLKPDDIKPGVDIPARLITCLQESVTKRSDVYVADKWLKSLEKDYCKDLVKDTTDALKWLEWCNDKGKVVKKYFYPFTFDFDSLYDRISPDLAFKALQDAMATCRPSWSSDFKSWLLELVDLSLESSIGEYAGNLFKARKGLPTGGSLIVQLANISVFFVLNKVLYSNSTLMNDVVSIKRYIDDGIGVHTMTERRFELWKVKVSKLVLDQHRLLIKESDWSVPKAKFSMINFLDINFSFDKNNALQTDLYKKPTDARCFLSFSSCHPQYTFSGTVYSQALRLRRIINDDARLQLRLTELGSDFIKCKYPPQMVGNIMKKVMSMRRSLEKKVKDEEESDKVMVISTYGRDKQLVNTINNLKNNCESLKFQFVKKSGPSLGNILAKSKSTALGHPFGKTSPCPRARCGNCDLMSGNDFIKMMSSSKIINTAYGSCITRMLIYHTNCKICEKSYVGKTVQILGDRINGHRNKFYDCLRGITEDKDSDDDEYVLGRHLVLCHNLQSVGAFNENYRFTVLEHCSPFNLDLNEHKWIQRLKCIKPFGLNSHDPFGIPLVL